MSQIIKNPLTPEQMKQRETVSAEKIREAQDALFMYLLDRVAALEEKISAAETQPDEAEGKIHIINR